MRYKVWLRLLFLRCFSTKLSILLPIWLFGLHLLARSTLSLLPPSELNFRHCFQIEHINLEAPCTAFRITPPLSCLSSNQRPILTAERPFQTRNFLGVTVFSSGSSLPSIFCIHVRSVPIYWRGYLPCKNKYKVMVFYM